jgi:hypothetical protein
VRGGHPPPCFWYVRILKGLRADEFWQNTVKRGVCLEVLILMEIEKIEKRNSKLEMRNPKRGGTLPLPRKCRIVRKRLKMKDGNLRFGATEGAGRRFEGGCWRYFAGRLRVERDDWGGWKGSF